MVMFWPRNLPENIDSKLEEDDGTYLDSMADEGRILIFADGANGQFSVSAFLDEEPPAQLKEFLGDEEIYPDVLVKGSTIFSGSECLGEQDLNANDEFQGMFSRLKIPEGMYQAIIYRTTIPPAFSRRWLMDRLGTSRYRILHWQQLLSRATMLGIIGSLLAFFFLALPVWLILVAVVALSFVASVLLARSEACQEAIVAIDEFTELYPEFVVVFSSLAPEGSYDPDSVEVGMPVGSA